MLLTKREKKGPKFVVLSLATSNIQFPFKNHPLKKSHTKSSKKKTIGYFFQTYIYFLLTCASHYILFHDL